jgi:hypothetical protein
MTHKLIKTDNYLFVVDDSEIKVHDYYLRYNKLVIRCIKMESVFNQALNKNEVIISSHGTGDPYERSRDCIKKIIAHLPLNGSPVLEGVPLLPPLEDDEVEKDAEFHVSELDWDTDDFEKNCARISFKAGYNKAKEKYKYTEEDMSNAISHAYKQARPDTEYEPSPLFYQYPTEFECESQDKYVLVNGGETRIFERKTTTNSQGQTEWVGKYIY